MSKAQLRPLFNEREITLIHELLSKARKELTEKVCFSEDIKERECGRCGLRHYCLLLVAISRFVNENADRKANTTFGDRRRIANTLRQRIEEMRSDF